MPGSKIHHHRSLINLQTCSDISCTTTASTNRAQNALNFLFVISLNFKNFIFTTNVVTFGHQGLLSFNKPLQNYIIAAYVFPNLTFCGGKNIKSRNCFKINK